MLEVWLVYTNNLHQLQPNNKTKSKNCGNDTWSTQIIEDKQVPGGGRYKEN